MNGTNRQLLQKLQQFKKKEFTNKKVVIPAEAGIQWNNDFKFLSFPSSRNILFFVIEKKRRGIITPEKMWSVLAGHYCFTFLFPFDWKYTLAHCLIYGVHYKFNLGSFLLTEK